LGFFSPAFAFWKMKPGRGGLSLPP
jgi:hypothetical protein